MLRYTTDRARPGLVALYDIRPGNGAGQFLQPQSPHGADKRVAVKTDILIIIGREESDDSWSQPRYTIVTVATSASHNY